MKKTTILILVIVMGISFISLLYLQVRYIEEIVNMRKEHFNESVERSLYQTSHQLEVAETARYLENGIVSIEYKAYNDSTDDESENSLSQSEADEDCITENSFTESSKSGIAGAEQTMQNKYFTKRKGPFSDRHKSLNDIFKSRYSYEKRLIDEVIYSLLYDASDRPLEDRIDFRELDQILKSQLHNNGIDIPYHFTVSTQDGREVYRCPDYTEEGEDYTYSQVLFRNDPSNKMGVVKIHFPDMGSYIFSGVRFMVPSVAFTVVLLVTFIFTIVVIFRQKRYTEIKNDFINNMTHELKTPISSISLAAQMLNDEAVTKSPVMMKHLGGVINDESKRLRFLVEKVLQMSMFDRKKAIFNKKELNLNELVESVANTFTLRVEHTGGHITTALDATEPTIYVDEMHFTNVIFNLLDNAVKYRDPERPVELTVKTWNDKEKLYLSVKDNGMGIKKENLKKIFEKFYRVHTGNVHDVKGFGLGLAYVKKMVDLHKGEIHVESERGKGTNFIISLPIIKK